MALRIIREQLLKFISDSSPSVVAIKGEWGVGKTYAWEGYLAEARKEKMISCKRYSYVSLFGVSSMENLKNLIFENSIDYVSGGGEPSFETYRANAFNMLEKLGRGSLRKFRDVPFIKSAAPAVETFSFMSINNTLICIDDLERRGAGLDLKDVLGLVSHLKEKKKCKIILLLNDGTETTEDYEKHKEKVMDMELDFSPTPEESANIAFDGSKTYHHEIIKYTTELKIINIRILLKIRKYVDMVFGFFEKAEEKIKSQLLMSTTLFCWSYYSSKNDTKIPTLEFIEKVKDYIFMGKKDGGSNHKLWRNILLSYNFTNFDGLDKQLAKLVRKGYIDRLEFEAAVQDVNKKALNDKSLKDYQSAWDDFHHDFSKTEAEIKTKLYASFLNGINLMTPGNLNSIVRLFNELGDERACYLIDKYIDVRGGEVELFNVNSFENSVTDFDEKIKSRFKIVYEKIIPRMSVADVVDRMVNRSGWREEDEIVLSEATEEDFYNYFINLSGVDITQNIAACLKYRGSSNSSGRQIKIINNVEKALRKIASQSKLNALRLSKFGI
ncbi:hypothetical protein C7434_3073 [Pantoea sp. PNA 14-12]|uniref:P-loop NTPase fold protein n=1 Tax=Pantoea TaxID=53335 RepID=UPI0010DBF377|nr:MULTISPECIES: P-loop NTPase fold protein [Pantoea]TDS68384.1 hypothetical protein C7434_3073 [Pantoea sp. PNA 14-12]